MVAQNGHPISMPCGLSWCSTLTNHLEASPSRHRARAICPDVLDEQRITACERDLVHLGSYELVNSVHRYLNSTKPIGSPLKSMSGAFISQPSLPVQDDMGDLFAFPTFDEVVRCQSTVVMYMSMQDHLWTCQCNA